MAADQPRDQHPDEPAPDPVLGRLPATRPQRRSARRTGDRAGATPRAASPPGTGASRASAGPTARSRTAAGSTARTAAGSTAKPAAGSKAKAGGRSTAKAKAATSRSAAVRTDAASAAGRGGVGKAPAVAERRPRDTAPEAGWATPEPEARPGTELGGPVGLAVRVVGGGARAVGGLLGRVTGR